MSTEVTAPSEDVLRRIRGEYTEMPGLRVTLIQAQRLWGLDAAACHLALESLLQAGFLRRTEGGQYVRPSERSTDPLPLRMARADLSARPSYRRPAAS